MSLLKLLYIWNSKKKNQFEEDRIGDIEKTFGEPQTPCSGSSRCIH